jgi:hypothetical protein
MHALGSICCDGLHARDSSICSPERDQQTAALILAQVMRAYTLAHEIRVAMISRRS